MGRVLSEVLTIPGAIPKIVGFPNREIVRDDGKWLVADLRAGRNF